MYESSTKVIWIPRSKSTIRLISFTCEKITQFATEITANVKPTYMHDPAKDKLIQAHK